MDRRCTDDVCLARAGARSVNLDMPLATTLMNPRPEWNALSRGKVRIARDIQVDWEEFPQDQYLFSHCTIVASLDTEENGYHIKPACSDLVNNNGNGWSNPVLMATFPTFIGAENYLEHIQIPELSKGKILDAVLRPLTYKSDKGLEANIYYCDILVATNRKHGDLVKKIEGGDLSTMSMGCLADYVQCSRCGKIMADSEPNCSHVDNDILRTFVGDDGVERVVAELCGRTIVDAEGKVAGDPGSVRFIEASWVERPAFCGAVLNHYVSDISQAANLIDFSTNKLEATVEDLFKMRVADANGMIAIRVARDELMKRKRETVIDRVARSRWI